VDPNTPLNFFAAGRALERSEWTALDPETLIAARHITTCPDGGASIEKFGLLPLRQVLTEDTPLRQFLHDHGVIFDPEKRLFLVKGEVVHLLNCMESCASCLVEKTVCRLYSRESKRVLSVLYADLSPRGGSPAYYLYYSPQEEASLPEAHSPRVLRLLDDLLTTLDKPACLVEEWTGLCGGKYKVIEKTVKISELPQKF
jgi:hypothetical protein